MPASAYASTSPPPVRQFVAGPPPPWYLRLTSRSTLPWLVRLRMATAACEAALALVGSGAPGLDLPLTHIALLLLAVAMNNAAFAVWMSSGRVLRRPVAALGMVLDVVLLTALLDLTGGLINPFAAIYVVVMLLAALTLGRWGAAGLGIAVVGCLAGFAHWHPLSAAIGHHRVNDVPTYLFALWISAAITAELAIHVAVRGSAALVRREEDLDRLQQRTMRSERLVALTTLAAGAAHELSTPLATIALASRELEHAATARGTVPDLAGDARLIRQEVDRCRTILDRMSGRAGGGEIDAPCAVDLAALIDDLRCRLGPTRAARLEVTLPARAVSPSLLLPRTGLLQVLLSLVTNAFDALDGSASPVVMEIACDMSDVRVLVQDSGRGLTADALKHVGEPFYTTKAPGCGRGLGVFLARAFAERLGGSLDFYSEHGTTVVLSLPRIAPAMASL